MWGKKKKKEITKCNKSIVKCDVEIVQCKNEIVKCDVVITWYTLPYAPKKLKKGIVELPKN